MNHYRIRFNKTRGKPGRGTLDHVWRVFEGDKEYVVKNCRIDVPSYSEVDASGVDWNISCDGYLELDRTTSTAIIRSTPPLGDSMSCRNIGEAVS